MYASIDITEIFTCCLIDDFKCFISFSEDIVNGGILNGVSIYSFLLPLFCEGVVISFDRNAPMAKVLLSYP